MVDLAFATAARFADGSVRTARCLTALCCVWFALFATPVHAAENADGADLRKAEAAATEAKVFFKAGLFDKASAKFMEAYAISKRPSLMYNAARAYEEGSNFRESVALLKHYRDLQDVGVDGKRDADERIARMEGVLRQQAADEARKIDDARRESTRLAAEQKKREDADRAERERLERARVSPLPEDVTATVAAPKSRKVSWPLVIGALGAGLIAGGAYAEALYEANNARSMTIADQSDVNTYLAHVSDAKTFPAVAIAGAVVGAGLAGWAVLDWWRSSSDREEKLPTQSSVSVFPAPGGGMLSLRGSF